MLVRIVISLCLFIFSAHLYIIHLGTVPALIISEKEKSGPPGIFIEKTNEGHRHIILSGPSYHRGHEYSRLTKNILIQQEELMLRELNNFIPTDLLQKLFFLASMVWFNELDQFIDHESLKEMQGVASTFSNKYEYLASNLTRQVAYHALHEVGQMFVDEDRVDMGCFVAALKDERAGWFLGRNFDFDVKGFFDREKILKWVFPENGIPYLSVIWSGMVGAVTGVNQESIFVSINAAGSDDYSRVGAPTTIVVKNILEKTRSINEAITYLEKQALFTSEIFTLADGKTQEVYVIEKSPHKMTVKKLNQSSIVSNHFREKQWNADKSNNKRKIDLTTNLRYQIGEKLLKTLPTGLSPTNKLVKILRSKKIVQDDIQHNGHRGAIDSMIASQSVIYNLKDNIFYVNLGPGTNGKYLGYDLQRSFKEKTPLQVASKANDKDTTAEIYPKYRGLDEKISKIRKIIKRNKCLSARKMINELTNESIQHYNFSRVKGDFFAKCENNRVKAVKNWNEALEHNPPFLKIVEYLKGKIK